MNKKLTSFLKVAWIIIGACVAIFFTISVFIYTLAKPKNVVELLPEDDSWLPVEILAKTEGDLETYPYVTKLYEYGTNDDSIKIVNYTKLDRAEIRYGSIENPQTDFTYYVECFVCSNIADKSLVKKLWNISVDEGESLILKQTKSIIYAGPETFMGDIKREFYERINYGVLYKTFARITVKPGHDDISFTYMLEK